jgi:membrane-associated phospholipid phosphatase
MILPYMSLDLFFFLSPFFCTSRRELRTHVLRLLLAMNVAAICFLAFPLKMGFRRPAVGGFNGMLFALLGSFDRPYNLVPSLHIALLILVGSAYIRHSRGWVQLAVLIWFMLIGASALLTWQHHAIDIVGGFALGLICLHLLPMHQGTMVSPSTPVPRRTPLPSPPL